MRSRRSELHSLREARLVEPHAQLRFDYPRLALRLAADVESPVEGLHDRDSRALVRALLEAWEAGGAATEVAARTRGALRRDAFAVLPR